MKGSRIQIKPEYFFIYVKFNNLFLDNENIKSFKRSNFYKMNRKLDNIIWNVYQKIKGGIYV